jgi:hypothetical protein
MNSARVPAALPGLETGEELGEAAGQRPRRHDDDQHERGRRGPGQGEHPGRQVDQPEQQVTEDRAGGPAAEGPRALQPRVRERVDREQMTSARIVTPGQAMAKIPTMTARMPSRINEVDDDLNMTGIPSACLSRTTSSGSPRRVSCSADTTAGDCRPTSAAYGGIAAG